MTLKARLTLSIAILFTLLYGATSALVILAYSDFRKQEFQDRLESKALTTFRLLLDVKEVDNQMLKLIDRNTINKLYDEKTLVFDAQHRLIYSSLDDTKINWSEADLNYLKKHGTFFRKDGDKEVYGIFYDSNKQDFYALISANDAYGKRKFEYLVYLLAGSYIVFTCLAWALTTWIVKKQVRVLDSFHRDISTINEYNLETRLDVKDGSANEIDLIGKEFNFMMKRIQDAYQQQKEFTAQASHELRTPITRMTMQLEGLKPHTNEAGKKQIEDISRNLFALKDLIDSLLLLSRLESAQQRGQETTRLDEAIFNSIEKIHQQHPDLKVSLHIEEHIDSAALLLPANQSLLEVALGNLLKNAVLYSNDKQVVLEIRKPERQVQLSIRNTGYALSPEDQVRMFQPFMRGSNVAEQGGFGLGLRIVQRILKAFHFDIRYCGVDTLHEFVITF